DFWTSRTFSATCRSPRNVRSIDETPYEYLQCCDLRLEASVTQLGEPPWTTVTVEKYITGMTSSKVKKPISLQHMNGWRLHRQFLDRPFPSKNILDLIKSIGWLYSPGCSTPYLSLWARMRSFKAEDLNRPVFGDRKLIQLETLRCCLMLFSRVQAGVGFRRWNRSV